MQGQSSPRALIGISCNAAARWCIVQGKAELLMNEQFKIDNLEKSDLRAHYEDVAANTLLSIVRHKLLIGALVLVALVLASLVIPLLPRKYAAEALVHPDLFSLEAGGKGAPRASIDAVSLVASQAHLISADAMVRAVVKRLGLDRDPEFAPPTSPLSKAINRARDAVLPETQTLSPQERATASVRKKLTVTNDRRAYLISISFTAVSPEKAAKVANAFAMEYLRGKAMQRLADAVTAAQRELEQRSAIHGEKHPSVVRAKAELEAARVRLEAGANGADPPESDIAAGEGITLAVPNPTPSSPKGLVILGLAFVSASVSGLVLAVWLDRRDTGFHDQEKILARTGVPCLGVLPPLSELSELEQSTLSLDSIAALRAVALGAGLIGPEGLARVAMVTSALPREGTWAFAAGLAKVLVSEGQRVLLIDTLSELQLDAGAISLEQVATVKARKAFFEAARARSLSILRRSSDGRRNKPSFALTGRFFGRLLAEARNHFDVVLIAAPPVMLFAETVQIGRNADVTLYIARWNRTPQRAVGSAIQRLRQGAVQVHGIILTDVKFHTYEEPRSTRATIEENGISGRAAIAAE
jgi:Mrp family chromosome partitioning ATPase